MALDDLSLASQVPMQASTLGEYIDQWQSGNIAITSKSIECTNSSI